MHRDMAEVLIDTEEIAAKIKAVGEQITKDFAGKELLLVSVLKGSVIFMADLMRAIDLPCKIDFMAVSSYGSAVNTTGAVKIIKDLDTPVENLHVMLVEDILDTGTTLKYLTEILHKRNPASITITTLLDKQERRAADIAADYYCFSVPDKFVVGYGLDFAEKYRNLPYIGVLRPELYQ